MTIYLSKGEAAIREARTQSEDGPPFAVGMCLREVRECYQVGPKHPDASTDWRESPSKHIGDRTPPRGVPVYWTGGSGGHGHIAIATGDGNIWSTDSRRPGYFDRVPLSAPERDWGLKYVGWSEHINGIRVYLDPYASAPNFKAVDGLLTRAMRRAATEGRRELAGRLRRILRREFK